MNDDEDVDTLRFRGPERSQLSITLQKASLFLFSVSLFERPYAFVCKSFRPCAHPPLLLRPLPRLDRLNYFFRGRA